MKPPYEITKNILELYGKITQLLGICESLMLVKPEARLRRQNRIRTIQSSLAIEGNTLNIENITAIIDNKSINPRPEQTAIAVLIFFCYFLRDFSILQLRRVKR